MNTSGIPSDIMAKMRKSVTPVAIEVMETGKAIATFNIMAGEDRNVICGLVCDTNFAEENE